MNIERMDTWTLFNEQTPTQQIAVGVMLAALYAVSIMIPISGFIAAAGFVSTISLSICIAPLFGVFLGPYRGAAFGLIAGLLATMVSAAFGSLYLIVPTIIFGPAIAGLLTGFIVEQRNETWLATIWFLVVVVLYWAVNFQTWWFVTPYMLAAVVAPIIPISGLRYDMERKGVWRFLQYVPLMLVGTIADFSPMTIGAVYILNIPADIFGFVIFPVMLLERALATIIASVLAFVIASTFQELHK